eukprot:gene11661-biopygen10711
MGAPPQGRGPTRACEPDRREGEAGESSRRGRRGIVALGGQARETAATGAGPIGRHPPPAAGRGGEDGRDRRGGNSRGFRGERGGGGAAAGAARGEPRRRRRAAARDLRTKGPADSLYPD